MDRIIRTKKDLEAFVDFLRTGAPEFPFSVSVTKDRRTDPRSPTDEQKDDIARRYGDGESSAALSDEYGVTRQTILNIVRARGGKVLTIKEASARFWARPENHEAARDRALAAIKKK